MDDLDGYVDIHGTDEAGPVSPAQVSPVPDELLEGFDDLGVPTAATSAAHEHLVVATMIASGMVVNGAKHALAVATSLAASDRGRGAIEILELLDGIGASETTATVIELQPLILESLLLQSEVFQSLGDHASAVPTLRRALALAQEHGDDVAYKAVVMQLATLRGRQIQFYTDAIGGYHQALRSRIKALGKDHPTVGASLNNLGVAHKSIGDFSKALAFFTKSLTIKLATGGDAAATVNNIAEVHRCLGDNTTALQYYEWAYEIRCVSPGDTAQPTINTMYNIGLLQRQIQDYVGAEKSFQRVVVTLSKLHGDQHPDAIDAARQARRCGELQRAAATARFSTLVLSDGVGGTDETEAGMGSSSV